MQLVRVSANSQSSAVAGAIAGIVRQQGQVTVQAVGVAAVNQAVKAVAIGIGFLKNDQLDIICVPKLVDVTIDDRNVTVLRLIVEPRNMDGRVTQVTETVAAAVE